MSIIKQVPYRIALKFNRSAQRELAFMRKSQWFSPEQVKAIQKDRLERLLNYAYEHVPHYRIRLRDAGLLNGKRIRLDQFRSLPILDKPTIRANFGALTSDEATKLHAKTNKTSGSTGEPLVFLQDREGVRITGGATLRLFYEWHGIQPGDREIRLWGLERDLFYRDRFTLGSIREWFSGIRMLNAFRMTPERMTAYISGINTYRPRLLRGYSANLFELAQFAEENGLEIFSPDVVISSAGTLYPGLRQKMESVYGASVFNHYGAREMHNMAMECSAGGFHMSAFTHFFEVLDDHNEPCPPGVEGNLVVTSLFNYAMPLIRYSIGDRGIFSNETCRCGRGLPLLEKVSGRRVDCLWTREGRIVPGEYFIYLLAVHLEDNPIAKYQVVQEDYDNLHFKLMLRTGECLDDITRQEIEEKTRLVMGEKCRMDFELVEDIPPMPSGKYLYTLCRIPDLPQPTADVT